MPTNEIPGSIPWIIGILIAVVLVLASVIVYMFKLLNARTLEHEKQRHEVDVDRANERSKWVEEKAAWEGERDAEIAELRLSYEEKHRELAEQYINLAMKDRAEHVTREKQTRDDFGDLLEKQATKAEASSAAMVELLHKLQDRLLGGPRRRGG